MIHIKQSDIIIALIDLDMTYCYKYSYQDVDIIILYNMFTVDRTIMYCTYIQTKDRLQM